MRGINWPVKIEGEPFERTCLRVQQWAQRVFQWRDDQQVWGMPEFWATADELDARFCASMPTAADGIVDGVVIGDCDDYAGLCLHALRRLGIDARYLTCWCETGGYHCVCLAQHDGEALVLDNRYGQPMSRHDLWLQGYKFDAMSGLHPGDDWAKVN